MKLIKKVLAIVLSLSMVLGIMPSVFAADEPGVIVDSVDAKPGDNVEVGISIANNPGIISMLLNVKYDDNLTLIKVEDEQFLKDSFHDKSNLTANPYVLNWGDDLARVNNTYNGKIVTLTFKVSESAPNGNLPVKIVNDSRKGTAYNFDLDRIEFSMEDGGVKVSGGNAGTGDGGSSSGDSSSDGGSSNGGSSSMEPEEKDPQEKEEINENNGEETIEPTKPQEETEVSFLDVKRDAWYFDAVMEIVKKGLMKGISDTVFAPDEAVTRAMFVTVLHRLSGDKTTAVDVPFSDVNIGEYYIDAVAWAKREKIVNGVTETEFAPNAKITREQMATMLYRYAVAMDMDTSAKDTADISSYVDAGNISDYATEGVKWVVGSGIMNGTDNNTFLPVANTTRAELATVFVRFSKM